MWTGDWVNSLTTMLLVARETETVPDLNPTGRARARVSNGHFHFAILCSVSMLSAPGSHEQELMWHTGPPYIPLKVIIIIIHYHNYPSYCMVHFQGILRKPATAHAWSSGDTWSIPQVCFQYMLLRLGRLYQVSRKSGTAHAYYSGGHFKDTTRLVPRRCTKSELNKSTFQLKAVLRMRTCQGHVYYPT